MTPAVNRNTTGLSAMPSTRGKRDPPTATITRTAADASASAIAEAAAEITSDSIRSCRTSCQRLAPSAVRTAMSRARAAPRAISRFATLKSASRSSSPVAANAMTTVGPRSPTSSVTSDFMTNARWSSMSGYFFVRSAKTRAIGPSSEASAVPGRSRT